MTNLNIIYIGHSESLEAFLHSNDDLFKELNKEFGDLYFVDANLFHKEKIDNDKFLLNSNFKKIIFSSVNQFNKYFSGKKNVAICNFRRDLNAVKIFWNLKKIKARSVIMSNFGNIQMSFITSKKHPMRALKTIFLRKISYRLILLLMIFRVLPQIDIRFLTNRQIYNDIHNNPVKKFLLKNGFLYQKKIILTKSRSAEYFLKNKDKISEDYIVHLDAFLNYKEETDIRGHYSNEIIQKHYFHLEKFLKRLSNIFDKEVIVCIHPLYDLEHHSNFFKDFKVYKFRTREFVYKSFITTTFDSSAIEDAVILKKNIIGFHSNFMSENEKYHARNYANNVGYTFLELIKDYKITKEDLQMSFKKNKVNYDKHLKNFHFLDEFSKSHYKIIDELKKFFK